MNNKNIGNNALDTEGEMIHPLMKVLAKHGTIVREVEAQFLFGLYQKCQRSRLIRVLD